MAQTNLLSEWSSMDPKDLVRGSTPEDIDKNCLELCRSYIGGRWLQATTTDDVIVTRIGGGLTNQLYKVQLSDRIVANHVESADEPHAVAIKLYEPKHYLFVENKTYDAFERLPDTIMLTMASQLGICPQVYGIFPNGFIQRFYEHEQFRPKHQARPELVRRVAQTLAKIHSMKVPLKKEKNPMFEGCRQKLIDSYALYDINGIAKEHNLSLFLERDLHAELDDLGKIFEKIDSPSVICHNDYRGSNILITEPDEKVMIVDIEYSHYGPRAFDMAELLYEWDKELLAFDVDSLPKAGVIEMFIKAYIEQMDQLEPGFSAKPANEFNKMVKEAKVYFLLNIMLFITFFMEQKYQLFDNMEFDKVTDLKKAHLQYQNYLKIKQQLIDEEII